MTNSITNMESAIKAVLSEHPGLRRREIAQYYLHIWHLNPDFTNAMWSLIKKGEIKNVTYSDPANMEYYDKWYLA